MKKQNICSVIVLAAALLMSVTACKFGAANSSDFTSETDKFSIAFPAGSEGVKTETDNVKYAKSMKSYSKSFDSKTPEFRSYTVDVLDIEPHQTSGKSERQILEIALNGWEKEADTETKDVTINDQKGIDSLREVTVGPVSMWFRDVVFFSEADMKLYVLKTASKKKELTQSKEAEDFVNSFKLSKGWF